MLLLVSLQVDMVDIKEVYFNMYGVSLADDIYKYCGEEDLKIILLSLIKGNLNLFL